MSWKIPILGGLFGLFLLVGVPYGLVSGYVTQGDSVYIDDSNVFISVTPHTLPSSGEIIINLTSKIYSGPIDLVGGFNRDDVSFSDAYLYKPLYVNTTQSFSCEPPYWYNYTVGPKYMWCWRDVDGNTTSIDELVFEHSFSSFDEPSNTIYWTESKYREWKPVTSHFDKTNFEHNQMNVWFYKSGFEVTAGESYLLKVLVDVPFCYIEDEDCDNSGKYTFAFKPSGLGISEAVAQGKLYELDPWFNISYAHKMPILGNTESGVVTYPILVNDTAFFINNTQQWVFCNLSVNTTHQPIGFIYFNNFTDYICVDRTETVQVRTDVVFGNSTDFGNPWPFSELGVFHSESDTVLIDDGQYGSDCAKNGAPALTSDGKVANAIDYESGTNDFYTCGDDPFNDYDDELTVMAWLKIESTAAIGIFLSKWTSWFVGVDTTPNIFSQANRDGTSCGTTSFGASTGTWIHVAYVMGPNSCTLYIDGVNRSAVFGTGTISATGNGLFIGKQSTSAEDYDGIMDEVIISNRSWSSDEIQAYYNNTEGTQNFTSLGQVETNVTPGPPEPVVNITLPIEQRFCFDDEFLFIRSKDTAENGSAFFNEYLFQCDFGCNNATLTRLGFPGCVESPMLLILIFIVMVILLGILIWGVTK